MSRGFLRLAAKGKPPVILIDEYDGSPPVYKLASIHNLILFKLAVITANLIDILMGDLL